MTVTEAERLLDQLALDPSTRRRCAPRYDELLVAVAVPTETTATVVLRSKKRGELRVVELARVLDRWTTAVETLVPYVVGTETEAPTADYPDREFHFVPGTGPAAS